ncbi:MAG: DNA polymerase III subunit alpha, partial [Patescibacteria group bacterium]|nr:DNA polymerase III subunit alpha [Patescibacteria group bacterium]
MIKNIQAFSQELKPTTFEDIIAMVALYRPGPLSAGFVDLFIRRKNGKEKIVYDHPEMEAILGKTYGVTVYQEQVMQISQKLAGFTGGQADTLRKAIGKKKADLLAKMEKAFIEGCKKNKIKEIIARKIWKDWQGFAEYAFNKSHSACYAMIAYQTAYLKANFPSEFMAALLTSDFGNLDRVAIEIEECEKMGVEVIPPDVNQSFVEFGVVPQTENILFGLSAIKNVGVGVAEKIVENRKLGPYKSLEDFVTRLGSEVINKKTMEALAKSGALDSLSERNKTLANLDMILKFSTNSSKNSSRGLVSMFGDNKANNLSISLKLSDADPADKKQRLAWEKELLGIYLSEHPLDEIKDDLIKVSLPISSLKESGERKVVTIGGIITSIQKIITKSKEPMIFAHFEDTKDSVEILVFPKLLKQNPLVWQSENILLVKGRKSTKDGALKFIAEEAKIFDPKDIPIKVKPTTIQIQVFQGATKDTLMEIKKTLLAHPGDCQTSG